MIRGFRYRLDPTPEQAAQLEQFAGVCRLIYNLAWEQRRDHWRAFKAATGRSISFTSQCRELTDLRHEVEWIANVPHDIVAQSLRDLDAAFTRWFAGSNGYPSPRKRRAVDAFRVKGRATRTRILNAKWLQILVPKIGWINFRDSRPLGGKIRNATISRSGDHWYVSIQCLVDSQAEPSDLPALGIDRGVANTLALSTGELLSLPATLATLDQQKRRAQRVLSRRRKGSNRRRKQLRRVARLSARIATVRRDWQHRASTDIARRFGHVAIEKLAVRAMTASATGTVDEPGRNVAQKRGLNRSILNQGWGAFATMLAYKLEERGGTLHEVPAAYTSQTCSACGCIDRESRKSQSTFRCVHCGHEAHADTNAALEILRRSTPLMRVEGHGCVPVEARSDNPALAGAC